MENSFLLWQGQEEYPQPILPLKRKHGNPRCSIYELEVLMRWLENFSKEIEKLLTVKIKRKNKTRQEFVTNKMLGKKLIISM